MIKPAFEILNQRGTPMFFSDVFANRPNAGIVGRIFISTDTFAFYRDNGVTWDLIGGPGTGTITGSGTAFKYPVFTNTQEIGDGTIEQLSTKNQSTKDFEIKTSTDDGIYESKLFLTNRFGGNDDTITFQYGKTILAGSPFLKISDNNATFPTSYLYYQGGQFAVNDALLVVTNTLQNNVADFFAVEPVVRIGATGASNNAQLTFSASAGTYAGIIRLGNSGNVFQIRTFANVVALQVNDNTSVSISNLGGSGNQMVVVDNTGLLSKQAIPTIFGSLATGQVAFGSATNTIAGSNNLFFDNANTRLGINTASPQRTLHLVGSGDTYIRVDGQSLQSLFGTDNVGTYIGMQSNAAMRFITNAIERMRLDASGNLGLGTTTPSAPLMFGKSVYGNPDSENFYRIKFQDNGGVSNDVGIGQTVAGGLAFNVGAASSTQFFEGTNGERMRLWAGGNLAIGGSFASNSGELLQVNGTMRVSGASTFTGTGASVKLVTTSDSAIWTEIANSGRTFYLGLDNTAGSSFGVSGASVLYSDGSRPMVFFTNTIERFRIASTGSATFSSSVTAASYTINDAGNITIGTTTGTKIGTATSQKIGFWNATPIVQPTTAVGSATFASPGAGSTIKTDDTFDGYTLQQVVKALRDIGILA